MSGVIEIEFRDVETGEEPIVVAMPRDEAPSIGDEVTLAGRQLKRLMPSISRPIVKPGVRHLAHSLPPWSPGAHSYDADGTPRVDAQRDIDNLKRHNPTWSYDTDR